jgi:NADH-quinone oxidoreductase subunit N
MPAVDLFPFLAPLILVACGGLVVLGFEAFLSRALKHELLPWIGAAFLLVAGIVQGYAVEGHVHGLLAMDHARMWLCGTIIASTLLGLAGLQSSLSRDDYPGGEPYALMLFAAAGAMVMTMANDTIALFIGLELASLSIYALVGLRRNRADSNEALFKYFAMGAVFSAIFLYGAALTYGATGSTHFGIELADPAKRPIFHLGQTLMLIGLLFKVGAVPFHFWSPDAYTGAPTAVTGFMGAVIKVGGFAALGTMWLNLVGLSCESHPGGVLSLNDEIVLSHAGLDLLTRYRWVFLVLALLSVVLGNFSALRQTNVRRLVAYSSIAHAGYMLLAFAMPTDADRFQLSSLWFYLVAYAIATAGALSAFAVISGKEETSNDLVGLSGQARSRPFHGLIITIFIMSFAGLPPTAGFMGKYFIFSDLVFKGKIPVAIFAMVMAVVGAAYYFRLVITLWSGNARELPISRLRTLSTWTLGAAALFVVVMLFRPNALSPVVSVAAVPATENCELRVASCERDPLVFPETATPSRAQLTPLGSQLSPSVPSSSPSQLATRNSQLATSSP